MFASHLFLTLEMSGLISLTIHLFLTLEMSEHQNDYFRSTLSYQG